MDLRVAPRVDFRDELGRHLIALGFVEEALTGVWQDETGRTPAQRWHGAVAGHEPRYFIITHGCQMNFSDSEVLAGLLETMGYRPAEEYGAADVILINTCAIRTTAEEKVFGKVGTMKRVKVQNPGAIIGLCGCMAQEEETREWLRTYAPHVDLVFGTHNLHRLPVLLDQAAGSQQPVYEVWAEAGPVVEHLPARRQNGLKAWVSVIYGCNHRCTFCIVPHTRGRERSRLPEDVMAEVEALAARGVREITFLGQNVNNYGLDLAKQGLSRVDFADLLAMADRVPGLARIRYTTSNPWNFPDKTIRVIAGSDKICEHFHLPVQSGSARILRLMQRGHDDGHYRRLVGRIRRAVPQASITTDLIAGFPGETEADFRALLDFLAEARFDRVGIFAYSAEEGTPAAGWPDQVPDEVKAERVEQAMALQRDIARRLSAARVGQTLPVLVEGKASVPAADWPRLKAGLAGNGAYPAPEYRPLLWGRTEFDAPEIDGRVYLFDRGIEPAGAGSLVRARVVDALDYDLVAVTEN